MRSFASLRMTNRHLKVDMTLETYKEADIVVFLVAHKEFKSLEYREDKVILDFAGIFKR